MKTAATHKTNSVTCTMHDSKAKAIVQPKLMVNAPGDRYEQEADAMANKVMGMQDHYEHSEPVTGVIGRSVQRKCNECDEEDKMQDNETTMRKDSEPLAVLQRSISNDYIYRKCAECEKEEKKKGYGTIMRKAESQGGFAVSESMTSQLASSKAGGYPLSHTTKDFMENSFSADFSSVRIHTDSSAVAMNREVNAKAFTYGSDIYFNSGEYDTQSKSGRHLLSHELTHVMQQSNFNSLVQREPQMTNDKPRVTAHCTQVNIQLPNKIYFSGTEGILSATIVTDIPVGDYWITYSPLDKRFVVGAIHYNPSSTPALNVNPGANTELFEKYRESVTHEGVRLNVSESSPFVTDNTFQFEAKMLSDADFLAYTGKSPDVLPRGIIVDGSIYGQPQVSTDIPIIGQSQPDTPSMYDNGFSPVNDQTIWPISVGTSSILTRFPTYAIPPNATGIIWTQMGAGHMSQFANVGGEMTSGGFRYRMWRNAFPWMRNPSPGSYLNDFIFSLMPNRTIVYRPTDAAAAEAFAETITGAEYNQTYRFPPRAGTDVTFCGTNCITVPAAEIKEALGGSPEILTPDGPVDITQSGRPYEGAPFEAAQAGRGATVREYLAQPDSYFSDRGLVRAPIPNMTAAARGGVAFVKVGGGILMIYGAYKTIQRLRQAYGTKEFPLVVAEETGSWTGGIIGSAVGSALVGGIVCAPLGPADLICVAGGFVGGLVFGTLGAIGLGTIFRGIVEYVQAGIDNPVLFTPAAPAFAFPATTLSLRGGYGGLLRSPLDVAREMRNARAK